MSPSPAPDRCRHRSADDRARAVDALLRDLGPRLRLGGSPVEAQPRLPTGLPELDRLLCGGFPRGRLSEITGPASSGRTSVALALLARLTRAEGVGAVVDAADAFDPASAEAAGTRLDRVLWVRAPGTSPALRSAERLLEAGGFALVLLDLAVPRLRVAPAAWQRLARATAASSAALVVLSAERAAGTSAELAVEMRARRARFSGTPVLFDGLELEIDLVRLRAGPARRTASVRLRPSLAA